MIDARFARRPSHPFATPPTSNSADLWPTMDAKVHQYPRGQMIAFHISNVLVFLLTWTNAVLGGIGFYDRSYQHHLKFFDHEFKTGIHRTAADLQWFCMENWVIPMMIFLAYPILTTVWIHIPRAYGIQSEGRELGFWFHALWVFCFFWMVGFVL